MAVEHNSEAWAQLVSVTDVESSIIPILTEKFVIGRSSDCDLPHLGNQHVSGKHCYIQRDDDGKVWLYDTSTNGTLLNLSIKLTKGECRQLQHGDEFHIVHKKADSQYDIGYMFQDIMALQAETSSDQEDLEDTEDYTQPNEDADATIKDDWLDGRNSPGVACKKRKSVDICDTSSKKARVDSAGEKPSSKSDGGRGDESLLPEMDKVKDSKGTDNTTSNAVDVAKTGGSQEPEDDAIAESLMCTICQEILHDCISLQPCMHSFCSGCYSEWMERSNECPTCRLKVERINKNHIVNNLVEAYLKVKPDMKRSESDLQELNTKNKITKDMLYPNREPRGVESEDEDENEEGSQNYNDENSDEENSDDETDNNNIPVVHIPNNPAFIFRPPRPVCRQCRDYRDDTTTPGGLFANVQNAFNTVRNMVTGVVTAGASTSGAGPSTGDGNDRNPPPVAPPYVCPPNANHVMCLCCLRPMPDRRMEFIRGGDFPPQQCSLCHLTFCHAYWGCQKVDCRGCLAKFKDMNFSPTCLTTIILDNPYESEIFKNFLEGKGISLKDMFKQCLAKLANGEYTLKNNTNNLPFDVNSPTCYPCALRHFKLLAYQYRRDIPNHELPADAVSRSNCYWGENCKTQRNKPEHARRFNHICPQTRVASIQ